MKESIPGGPSFNRYWGFRFRALKPKKWFALLHTCGGNKATLSPYFGTSTGQVKAIEMQS
jgi:hypothetical protein